MPHLAAHQLKGPTDNTTRLWDSLLASAWQLDLAELFGVFSRLSCHGIRSTVDRYGVSESFAGMSIHDIFDPSFVDKLPANLSASRTLRHNRTVMANANPFDRWQHFHTIHAYMLPMG